MPTTFTVNKPLAGSRGGAPCAGVAQRCVTALLPLAREKSTSRYLAPSVRMSQPTATTENRFHVVTKIQHADRPWLLWHLCGGTRRSCPHYGQPQNLMITRKSLDTTLKPFPCDQRQPMTWRLSQNNTLNYYD
ncbi:hypothetical protein XAUB_10590 [Xanthomonas citri pv. aurantifolii str. ICPB 11122]|nr:hypothetical protein XAUB_10590 [Xanthomonas citri pv. aurantifolii str. ICPB 11122]